MGAAAQTPDDLQNAIALHRSGRAADAERVLTAILKHTPDHPEALHLLGLIAAQSGRMEEALALFDRAVAGAPEVAEIHSNRGITLRKLNRLQEAAESYDRAIALKPNIAEFHANRSVVMRRLRRFDEALASSDRLISLTGGDADAFCARGMALGELGRPVESLAALDQALALDPEHVETHFARGNTLKDLGRLEEALACYDYALAARPDHANTHHNRGTALRHLKRTDEAIQSFDAAAALAPGGPNPPFSKALALLAAGRFTDGWRLYEWRKRLEPKVAGRQYAQPLWTGAEPIAGKTIFLWWEQGLGDTLQFCRYVPMVQAHGARVVLSVQEPLVKFLRQLSPDVKVIGPREEPAHFDFQSPLLTLPLAFGTTLDNIPLQVPTLRAPHGVRSRWAERLPPRTRPRVGLAWNGNPTHKNDRQRSIAVSDLDPLFSFDAEWVCLQKERRKGDEAVPAAFYGEHLSDFGATAALIEQLDLVVTADTSVGHLAGAMARPVWILVPYMSDWRWLLNQEVSPWYPTARLFRQPKPNDWGSVIRRVRLELARRFPDRR